MQPRQIAVCHQPERVFKMRVGFRGEARNDIGPKGHIWPQPLGLFAKPDRVIPQMAPRHAFQNKIVTMLQRQMQMRHEPRLGRDGLHQVLIHFDRVNRADPEPRQIGHQFQDPHHQIAKFGLSRQIRAPRGQIHAGQNDFVKAFVDKPFDLIDDNTRWDRT